MKKTDYHIAYVFPNLLTAASCFFGILSVVASFEGEFEKAIIFIFISLVLDGLDGRVARLTNTTSKFGVEFDSLCDLVAFGVAPAMLFYCAMGHEFGRPGILASGIFVVFGAIRLARFNVTTMQNEPNIFIGLPIPMAAISVVSWVALYIKFDFHLNLGYVYTICIICIGLLMVSNIRYPSFKQIDLNKTNFRKVLVLAILLLALLYIKPIEFMATVTTSYMFYGVIRVVLKFYLAKIKK
ncbi:MAG: CDP-diacylglycerol--serine O-phosphatidyltransferase [Campylobacter sp.]|nr:CDP-diacylglycerol--serine O-phosphatidyltransferase [Campylobacter sp.]